MALGFLYGAGGGSALDPFIAYTRSFDASGAMDSFIVPATGIYCLEVWGAGASGGGYGGYSKGYALLEKDEVIYVACGNTSQFNGGAKATNAGSYTSNNGGGATHMAKVTGELATIGKTEFVDNHKGLIVAGGAGGGANRRGGHGGGLEGGRGLDNSDNPSGTAANQSTGGTGYSGTGTFGQGAQSSAGSGGGGGLYGGGGGGYSVSAGGGSGYIDGVPAITYDGITYSPETQMAVNSGLGKAKVTRVA